ncbi:MAG TPA: helix-turn-helix transcriptional regulator [Thermaerobacter sp.]
MDDLGRRLRRIRESRNLSIYDVERRTGMHFSTISKYERNERQPSLEMLRELAAVYQVPVAALIVDVRDLEAILPRRVAVITRQLLDRPELLLASERLAAMTRDQIEALLTLLDRLGVQGDQGQGMAEGGGSATTGNTGGERPPGGRPPRNGAAG